MSSSRASANVFIACGAVAAAVAVATGAFGAHALKPHVTPVRLATFETAARYAMYHGLGLIAIGMLTVAWPWASLWLRRAGYLLAAGIVLFSGSLWLLVLTDTPAFGLVTPLGGLCFIGGWGALAYAAWRQRTPPGSQ